jgi:ATP diphosphatase
MAAEDGAFTFEDVVEAINTKMIRRHPHVFGDEAARSAGAAKGFWERIKAEERKGTDKEHERHLDGIPLALPALTRALKLQKRAAKVGFDWPDISHVLDKVVEEAKELAEARETMPRDRQAEEFGDLMFVMVNLGRHLGLDAEDALRHANAKFTRRFNYVEKTLEVRGTSLDEATLEQMDAVWDEIRARDKETG